eukprot:CAMPEP_0197672716 /NCGR_PEP_ID=MMETSP1338-20131121/79511_1 /TAXON_ID=43686 ORGANISM="Pelagodinium beii, Strain RCC1491" /NCGR_SAMPLE_ID=MMETSP1338 /ASSEMBLY_ACC=CAM_ASM_000754 /LENGTH=98 /DNA_ID=CAMNT_0043252855 /DNA_START=104 /DNA_END=398 /DNA_ORIENTATION=-
MAIHELRVRHDHGRLTAWHIQGDGHGVLGTAVLSLGLIPAKLSGKSMSRQIEGTHPCEPSRSWIMAQVPSALFSKKASSSPACIDTECGSMLEPMYAY